MALRSVLALVLVLAFIVTLGAGCEKKPSGPAGSTPAAAPAGGTPAGAPAAAPAGDAGGTVLDPAKVTNGATISGTVTVDGNVPAPAPIDMKSKPECTEHATTPVLQDQLIAGANKGLKDCFVYVKKGLEKYKFNAPTEPAVIDQKGCTYHPHVFGMMVGQDLKVLNSDPFAHNIKIQDNNPQNISMIKGQEPVILKAHFKREGVPTNFACEIHSWMGAKACVVKHPYYAVTDAEGKFTIKGLPAGKYTIAVWHEIYPGLTPPAQKEVEIEVKEGDTKPQDFKYTFAGN